MKNYIVLILLLICPFYYAQEDMGWDAKFAIGGGFVPGWIIPDFKTVNNQLTNFGVDKFSSAGFFSSGGVGYVSIGVVENLRVGGIGFGGSITHKGTKDGFRKEAKYSVSLAGLTIEYSFPFIKDIAISVGSIIGVGNTSLELYQNSGSFDWNNVWKEVSDPNENTQNISRTIYNTFFSLAPTLNVDIPVYRFFAFRIGGGYMFDLSKNWKADNGQAINNVPSDLSSNALFIQAGIFVGYFNY